MSGEEFTDEELEEIRRRRMAELQRASSGEQRRARAQQQVEVQKQSILRQILTPEARQRLTNIKMVRPEFAEQLELQLMQLAQSGKVNLPISDQQLKEALARMQSQRREIQIRRQ
ncbi:DNA-binding protein [Candidatus Bathyarchaeota archaeon]|jgi:programmed cell death protein 5|nr:DNA-binding protein [Candidatus Bathyarchaeota archaeon]